MVCRSTWRRKVVTWCWRYWFITCTYKLGDLGFEPVTSPFTINSWDTPRTLCFWIGFWASSHCECRFHDFFSWLVAVVCHARLGAGVPLVTVDRSGLMQAEWSETVVESEEWMWRMVDIYIMHTQNINNCCYYYYHQTYVKKTCCIHTTYICIYIYIYMCIHPGSQRLIKRTLLHLNWLFWNAKVKTVQGRMPRNSANPGWFLLTAASWFRQMCKEVHPSIWFSNPVSWRTLAINMDMGTPNSRIKTLGSYGCMTRSNIL